MYRAELWWSILTSCGPASYDRAGFDDFEILLWSYGAAEIIKNRLYTVHWQDFDQLARETERKLYEIIRVSLKEYLLIYFLSHDHMTERYAKKKLYTDSV